MPSIFTNIHSTNSYLAKDNHTEYIVSLTLEIISYQLSSKEEKRHHDLSLRIKKRLYKILPNKVLLKYTLTELKL